MARRTQLWQALGLAIIHAAHSTLVAHYSFDDGTAAEDSDGSLDGTISGATATTGRDGSGALAFDGTDDYVEFPSAVTADILGSNPRTVCLWAVIDAFDGNGGLFYYGAGATLQDFGVRTTSTTGQLRLQIWGTSLFQTVTEATDGAWHHYCLAFDGTTVSFYFDGGSLYSEALALNTGERQPPRPAPRAPLACRTLVRIQARRTT